MGLGNLFVDPDAFFEKRVEDQNLRSVLVVVALAGLGNVASILVIMPRVVSSFPQNAQTIVAIMNVVGATVGFIAIFVFWLFVTSIFFVATGFFDGERDFRTLLYLVAWGFVPSVVNALLTFFVTFYAFRGVQLPNDPKQIQVFLSRFHEQPVFFYTDLFGLTFEAWRGFIWMFAVKAARSVNIRQAAISVWPPVLLLMGWNLFKLLT